MPCNSDYLAPNAREQELRRAAFLLRYVYTQLGEPVSPNLRAASLDQYCKEDYIPELCSRLKKLKRFSRQRFEELVYNAKNATSRDLAAWWEEHTKADQARKRQEKEEADRNQLREQALAKLTPAERKALGH